MRRVVVPLAIAACLLGPALASAAAPSDQYRQTRPGMGVFSGAGNLWGGATSSAGGPPGAVPGTTAGQEAHQQGIRNQPRLGQPSPKKQSG